MEQNANIFSQLYWGGVIAAVIYGLLISVPVIAKLMFGNVSKPPHAGTSL